MNRSNKNQVPHPVSSVSSFFQGGNMPKYVRKSDTEPEKFSGDLMKYQNFIRRLKMKIRLVITKNSV